MPTFERQTNATQNTKHKKDENTRIERREI